MSYENITYEKRGPIAYVTLDRPDKLNALSKGFRQRSVTVCPGLQDRM